MNYLCLKEFIPTFSHVRCEVIYERQAYVLRPLLKSVKTVKFEMCTLGVTQNMSLLISDVSIFDFCSGIKTMCIKIYRCNKKKYKQRTVTVRTLNINYKFYFQLVSF